MVSVLQPWHARQPLGQRLRLRQRVVAAYAEPIDELIELPVTPQGEVALERAAIQTTQRCYNGPWKTRRKSCGVSHCFLLFTEE